MSNYQQEYYEEIYYGHQVEGRGLLTTAQLQQTFDTTSDLYDEILGPLLPTDKMEVCVDCACGYGNFLYFLRRNGFANTTGYDTDRRQVELAKSIQLNAILGNALEAPRAVTNAGLIAAIDFIEHLDKSTAVRFLQDCHASLRVGGMLIVQCPCADGFTGSHDLCNDLTHRWAASSNMLGQLLRTVGFSKVKILDLTVPEYPTAMKRKILFACRRFARRLLYFPLRLLGISPPKIWANSQIAIAWK